MKLKISWRENVYQFDEAPRSVKEEVPKHPTQSSVSETAFPQKQAEDLER